MVAGLFKSFKRTPPQPYQLARLVDARVREDGVKSGRHIVCDIDKTYLETEFESLVRMARIAFEAAADKVTVTGASEVLLVARWDDLAAPAPDGEGEAFPRPLHFVSSSPPQLRPVLEEKLMMDGLDWSSDTFKNQAYNIRMGRMDLLRQHVAYKSLAILNLVAGAAPGSRFYMIGDNAESDAYIYTGIKLVLDKRLGPDGFRGWLEAAGVEPSVAADLAKLVPTLPEATVEAVLIRNVPGYTFVAEAPLTDVVQTFDNFFQCALLLLTHGLVAPGRIWGLTRRFHNLHGMTLRQLAGMLEAAKEAPGIGTDAREALDKALSTLGSAGDRDAAATLRLSLGRDSSRFTALTEPQLLQHARLWMQRLHAQKGKTPPPAR